MRRSASTEQVTATRSVLTTGTNTTAGESFPVLVAIEKTTSCVARSKRAVEAREMQSEVTSKSSSSVGHLDGTAARQLG
jgi:hypothetical protein